MKYIFGPSLPLIFYWMFLPWRVTKDYFIILTICGIFFLVLYNLDPSLWDGNKLLSFSYIQQRYPQMAAGFWLSEVNGDIN